MQFSAKPKKAPDTNEVNDYGYIICARNESAVIANLIKSINKQNYPKDKMHVFVIADNCTDNTAEVAKAAGAGYAVLPMYLISTALP